MINLRAITVATGFLLASTGLAAAQEIPPHGHYGHHMWGGGMGAGAIFGPLLMIFYIALLVAVVIVVVRWLAGSSLGGFLPPPRTSSNALEILKERFARGEIDKKEYDERRKTLES